MLFITHQLPKGLQVDKTVMLGKDQNIKQQPSKGVEK